MDGDSSFISYCNLRQNAVRRLGLKFLLNYIGLRRSSRDRVLKLQFQRYRTVPTITHISVFGRTFLVAVIVLFVWCSANVLICYNGNRRAVAFARIRRAAVRTCADHYVVTTRSQGSTRRRTSLTNPLRITKQACSDRSPPRWSVCGPICRYKGANVCNFLAKYTFW